MTVATKIRMILAQRGMNFAELSKKLNRSPSTISDKMKRDDFRESDLKEIAEILNYDYEIVFTDRETGKKI